MSKLKLVGAILAAFLPFNWMRVWAYRLFFGYRIKKRGKDRLGDYPGRCLGQTGALQDWLP